MKIISFTDGQSGEEWLSWRKNGIGASDISVLTRSNPYRTPLQLWEIKCGYRSEDEMNAAMAHGVRNEETARRWLNDHYQLNLKPVCVEDPDKPHYRASLDGYDFDEGVLVEIKCPISDAVLDRARTNQAVPSYWLDQVQWQIMLSNPKRAMIAMWDYRHHSCICIDVYGSSDAVDNMKEKAEDFWHHVQIGKAPDPSKGDYIEIEDDNLHELLIEYKDLADRGKGLSNRKKEVKKQIEEFGDDGNFMAYGFKVQRVTPSPKYDMEQMKLDGIPLDKYLKKEEGIGWYRIIPPK